MWEAEEVAAYFFVRRGEAIAAEVLSRGGESRHLRVLELGAGSSGLAGLAFWHVAHSLKGVDMMVELTDGESDNIAFLQ